ncbi:hypothetical protein ACFHYQ_24870 [Sphaerimonospora cavernae]|uniref:Uncharacterized protein n=1 Tax=Sphaerimonospora cavernae TaxID=1740611 RepID=A0ABV6UBE8_9ACTN
MSAPARLIALVAAVEADLGLVLRAADRLLAGQPVRPGASVARSASSAPGTEAGAGLVALTELEEAGLAEVADPRAVCPCRTAEGRRRGGLARRPPGTGGVAAGRGTRTGRRRCHPRHGDRPAPGPVRAELGQRRRGRTDPGSGRPAPPPQDRRARAMARSSPGRSRERC